MDWQLHQAQIQQAQMQQVQMQQAQLQASGYTPEQLAAWQQYQQQYQQWHEKYYDQYQKEMQAKLGTTMVLPGVIQQFIPQTATIYQPSTPSMLNIQNQPPPPPPPSQQMAMPPLPDVPPPNDDNSFSTSEDLTQNQITVNKNARIQKSEVRYNQSAAPLVDEQCPEEKIFDEQFKKWEEQFENWKKENANHPDRKAYREYEQQFEDCRKKLVERRNTMRRKKLEKQKQTSPNFSELAPNVDIMTQFSNQASTCYSNVETIETVPSFEPTVSSTKMSSFTGTGFSNSTNDNAGIPGLDLVAKEAESESLLKTDSYDQNYENTSSFADNYRNPLINEKVDESFQNPTPRFSESENENSYDNNERHFDRSNQSIRNNFNIKDDNFDQKRDVDNQFNQGFKQTFDDSNHEYQSFDKGFQQRSNDFNRFNDDDFTPRNNTDRYGDKNRFNQQTSRRNDRKNDRNSRFLKQNDDFDNDENYGSLNEGHGAPPLQKNIPSLFDKVIEKPIFYENESNEDKNYRSNQKEKVKIVSNERVNIPNLSLLRTPILEAAAISNTENSTSSNNIKDLANALTDPKVLALLSAALKSNNSPSNDSEGKSFDNEEKFLIENSNNRIFNPKLRKFIDKPTVTDNSVNFGKEWPNENNRSETDLYRLRDYSKQNLRVDERPFINPFSDEYYRPSQVIDYQNKSVKQVLTDDRLPKTKVVDYGHKPGAKINPFIRESTFIPSKTIDYGHQPSKTDQPKTIDYGHQSNKNDQLKTIDYGHQMGRNEPNNEEKKIEKGDPSEKRKKNVEITEVAESNPNYPCTWTLMNSESRKRPGFPTKRGKIKKTLNEIKSSNKSFLKPLENQKKTAKLDTRIIEHFDLISDDEENYGPDYSYSYHKDEKTEREIRSSKEKQVISENSKIITKNSSIEKIVHSPKKIEQTTLFRTQKSFHISKFPAHKCIEQSEIYSTEKAIEQKTLFSSHEPVKQKMIFPVQMSIPTKENNNTITIDEILLNPGRKSRPKKLVIIFRGPPGSGKSYVAKLIKDKENEYNDSSIRVLSIDDYFMVETDKMEECPKTGRKITVKHMVYEFDGDMQAKYLEYLIKSFKKTLSDKLHNFIIIDYGNQSLRTFTEFYNISRAHNFMPYTIDMFTDLNTCLKQDIHNRGKAKIEEIIDEWKITPPHYIKLDVSSLLHDEITEIEMETVSDTEFEEDDVSKDNKNHGDDDEKDNPECLGTELNYNTFFKSKWDADVSEESLARLDGANLKNYHKKSTLEEYLQEDGWEPPLASNSNKKRVRWADIEEKRAQDKMRAIGFVVGQTDWKRMMDPTGGSSALTKTKYIDKVKKPFQK